IDMATHTGVSADVVDEVGTTTMTTAGTDKDRLMLLSNPLLQLCKLAVDADNHAMLAALLGLSPSPVGQNDPAQQNQQQQQDQQQRPDYPPDHMEPPGGLSRPPWLPSDILLHQHHHHHHLELSQLLQHTAL